MSKPNEFVKWTREPLGIFANLYSSAPCTRIILHVERIYIILDARRACIAASSRSLRLYYTPPALLSGCAFIFLLTGTFSFLLSTYPPSFPPRVRYSRSAAQLQPTVSATCCDVKIRIYDAGEKRRVVDWILLDKLGWRARLGRE